MEIKPPTNQLYTAITSSIATTKQTSLPNSTPVEWRVSQILQAVITQITDKQLILDIQGIKANTAKPAIADLQIGDKLKLEIEQLKPMPQFRIISLEKAINTHLITQALRNIASQNTSTIPLFKDISYVASRPAIRPAPLPAEVNAAVRDIFKLIPSVFNLKTATQIKEQLHNSGLFIENKIKNHIISTLHTTQNIRSANIQSQLNSNLKPELVFDLGIQLHRLANLIRTQLTSVNNPTSLNPQQATAEQIKNSIENKTIAQQMNRATTEQVNLQNMTQREEAMQTFLRQIESSLTHMQQTQLQSLNESQAGRPTWLMELPIKDGQDIDLFELRISEEESTQAEDEVQKIWNVTLKFDLSGLGKIKAHIKMQNNQISTQFFSEKKETLALFQNNLDFLKNRLNYNGLNVGNIECTHAAVSDEVAPIHSPSLDERI